MRKLLLICAMLLMTSRVALAETVSDENAAKDLATKIVAKIEAGDIDAGYQMVKAYSVPSNYDEAVSQAKKFRESKEKEYGKFLGVEFIDSTKRGDSLLMLRCIGKYENYFVIWRLFFYKKDNGWLIFRTSWGGTDQELWDTKIL